MEKEIEFASKIVDLKLALDRCCEGEGKKLGLFLTTHQILFIINKNDQVSPKEIMEKTGLIKSNLAIITKKMH